jgi:hypothetical protein
MRKIIAALAISAMALSGGTLAAKEKKSGEEKLAEMLKGRVAGEPQSCIPTNDSDNMSIIDGTALVYKHGRTIYVNRTAHPENLDWNDVLVITRFSASQLCKLDQIKTIDRGSGFFTGVVFLEDFVPYTLPKDGETAEGD